MGTSPQRLLAAIVTAAVFVGVGVSEVTKDATVKSIIIGGVIPPVASGQVKIGPSQLGRLPDGGTTYVARHRLSDGGVAYLRLEQADCVRRPAGGSSLLCRQGPSTILNEEVSELNRFPAAEAQPVVNNCEPCACSVWFGENADLDEVTLLTSTLGGLLP